MERFRWFRSRAFWFGVPGLVFLLWGWWVSMGNRSWVGFFGTWGVGQSSGEVYAYCFSSGWPDWPAWGDIDTGHSEVQIEEALEWKSMLINSPIMPDFRIAFIPYYWPVLAYVVVWVALLIWRKRRFDKRPIG